jgi:hypothetical protein
MNKVNTPRPAAPETPREELSGSTALTPPKLVVTLGRGARGKTWWIRWAAGRAHDQGRIVAIADADRTNATLSAYFGKVVTPPSADDDDMRDWFKDLCEQQIEKRYSIFLDLGGGDLFLKKIAREIRLATFLGSHGVETVAVHLIGPDRDDLAYLRDLEEGGLFAPQATILVLNEALVPAGRSVETAFKVVLDSPIFRDALTRGAKSVWMPRLAPAPEVDARRLTFAAAEAGNVKEGQSPIGLWDRELITLWRRVMEQNFAPVADWLP